MTMIKTTREKPTLAIPDLRGQIVGIDQVVPLLDGSRLPYVYLDNGASTPAFRRVRTAVDQALEWYSSVHRGSGFKSLLSTQLYDEAHQVVLDFVEADPAEDCVIFGKNTTEAINKLANRLELRQDDVVLTTMMEHHSNDLPWRARANVVYAGIRPDGSLDMADFQQKLEEHRGKVKLVTVTGASNVTGYVPPIYDIAEMAHGYGIPVCVDCAQLLPHRKITKGRKGSPRSLDFIVFSGHKVYAPFGSGALVGPKSFFNRSAPDTRGGGTIEIVTLNEVHWADAPDRDEAGSPNVIGAIALAASLRQLSEAGMDALAAHEAELTRYTLAKLARIPQVHIAGSADPARLNDRLGVISFQVEGMQHGKVAAILGFEGGIGVRDGCFCAHPYVIRLLGVSEDTFKEYRDRALAKDRTDLPGLVRVSFGCYNNFTDVDRLIVMLERTISGDFRGQYEVEKRSGSYFPSGYDTQMINRFLSRKD